MVPASGGVSSGPLSQGMMERGLCAMSLGILALKVGMTQVFDEKGTAHPVTVLQAGPCPVLQVKTVEKDGYNAVQASKRRERIKQGGTADTLSAKADCEPQKHIREFRLTEAASVAVGAKLTVGEVFKEGQKVDVIGTTKGRGYSGTMKRWNFAGLPASHGAKKVHRSVGSTSSLASNRGFGRPKKGKKMPGQYGAEQVTTRNLQIVSIDAENNVVLIRGSIPGHNNGLVMIRPTNKVKRKAQ